MHLVLQLSHIPKTKVMSSQRSMNKRLKPEIRALLNTCNRDWCKDRSHVKALNYFFKEKSIIDIWQDLNTALHAAY